MSICRWITEQLDALPPDRKRKMTSSDGVEFEIGSVANDLGGMKYAYFDGSNCFEFYVRHQIREDGEKTTPYPIDIIAADPPMWRNPSRKIFEQNIELFFQSSDPIFPGTHREEFKTDIAEFCGPAFTRFLWCKEV